MSEWEIFIATGRQRTRFGETPQYTEGLYDLENQVYAWMVPNGSWGESNAGLVVGDGESLLVDTLWDLVITDEMMRAMGPVTRDSPIKYLANTHADGDHIWGNQLVENAEIVMTKACDKEAREMKPASMTMLGKTGKAVGKLGVGKVKKIGNYFHNMVAAYNFKGVKVKAATRTFEGETALEVGGREVRLIEVGPAHTHGDLIVYVPDAKTLFCGDILFVGCTPVLWAGPLENWTAALDRILDMDVDVLVPGHGPVCDKEAVSRVREYFDFLGREVGRRFNAGMSAKDAAYDITHTEEFSRQAWSRWDSPERIMTNAHVIYRHLQRRSGHLKPAEKLNILRKQALLAYELPDAAPASTRNL
jgi:cyclase